MENNSEELSHIVRRRSVLFFTIVGGGSLVEYVYFLVLRDSGELQAAFASLFFLRGDVFMDFFNVPYWARILRSHCIGEPIYAPFTYLISLPFTLIINFTEGPFKARFTVGGLVSLTLSMIPAVACLAGVSARITSLFGQDSRYNTRLWQLLIFFCLMTSYPFVFAASRGNPVLWAMVFVCITLYLRRFDSDWTAFFLACAISIKYYMILCLTALWTKHRDTFFKVVVLILALNAISALLMGFTNIVCMVQALADTASWASIKKTAFYGSIFNLFYIFIAGDYSSEEIRLVETAYNLVAIPTMLALCWLIIRDIQDTVEQMFCSIIAAILFPLMSSSHYSLVLLIPFIPHILSEADKTIGTVRTLLLAVAFAPKHYLTFAVGTIGDTNIRLTEQSILNPLLLGSLLLLSLHFSSRIALQAGKA